MIKCRNERRLIRSACPLRMVYKHSDGKQYLLNLLDTPGHVDFSSEVLRSLLPSQGALLLVDGTQVSAGQRPDGNRTLTGLDLPRVCKLKL